MPSAPPQKGKEQSQSYYRGKYEKEIYVNLELNKTLDQLEAELEIMAEQFIA